MNDEAQTIAYANADFDSPHQAFIYRLREKFSNLPTRGHALDLGCGPGDITIRFAKAFPDWCVDGIDGAPMMLKLGQQEITAQGLQTRISFHQVYLPQKSAPENTYDFIFSNSLLHHLANPLDLWRSLKRFSKQPTPVFIMDLLRPESEAIAAQIDETNSGNEPEILRTDFYNSLCAAYTLTEIKEQLKATDLRHLEIEAISDRHWIAWGYSHTPSIEAR